MKNDRNGKQSKIIRDWYAALNPTGRTLSELRFQRLMRADQPDDFLQQLRRAIAIDGGRIDVAVLAADLFAWSMERRFASRRSGGMKFRWARDYYLKRPDQALIADTSQAP